MGGRNAGWHFCVSYLRHADQARVFDREAKRELQKNEKVVDVGQSQVINGASLQRSADRGLHVVSVMRTGCDEHFITAPLLSGDTRSLFKRAAEAPRDGARSFDGSRGRSVK